MRHRPPNAAIARGHRRKVLPAASFAVDWKARCPWAAQKLAAYFFGIPCAAAHRSPRVHLHIAALESLLFLLSGPAPPILSAPVRTYCRATKARGSLEPEQLHCQGCSHTSYSWLVQVELWDKAGCRVFRVLAAAQPSWSCDAPGRWQGRESSCCSFFVSLNTSRRGKVGATA